MQILVTGAAGFIGSHLSRALIAEGHHVVGLDNLNDYYSVALKERRIQWIQEIGPFEFIKADITDKQRLDALFKQHQFDVVVNLAAQAGVQHSLKHPDAYIEANIVGFMNILEACRHHQIKNLIYASSSSVYGANTKLPFSVEDNVDHPISLYAATKKSNELMAHCYSHLYEVPTTGLRFFTVYGPWGRPDMALFKFVSKMIAGQAIDMYNHGDMVRDFTYVDDIINGIMPMIHQPPSTMQANQPNQTVPYRLYNIGNNQPVRLKRFVEAIEQALGIEANINYLPMQPGDVSATHADVTSLVNDFNYQPNTKIQVGINQFVLWYRNYYQQ